MRGALHSLKIQGVQVRFRLLDPGRTRFQQSIETILHFLSLSHLPEEPQRRVELSELASLREQGLNETGDQSHYEHDAEEHDVWVRRQFDSEELHARHEPESENECADDEGPEKVEHGFFSRHKA